MFVVVGEFGETKKKKKKEREKQKSRKGLGATLKRFSGVLFENATKKKKKKK